MDRLWEGLIDGGTVMMPLDSYDWSEKYGWLADRWGLNWQIALGKHADVGRTVTPSLLFGGDAAGQAEAAIEHYTSVFPGATRRRDHAPRRQRQGRRRHGHARPVPHRRPGAHGDGQRRGRRFAFNEAVSLLVNCEDQAEIDRLWSALSAVPEAEACGWLKDRFGVSWQIVPRALGEMMTSGDRAAVERVIAAFMKMKKLDLPTLERAFAGTRRCRHDASRTRSRRRRPTSPRCAPCSTPSPAASTTATPGRSTATSRRTPCSPTSRRRSCTAARTRPALQAWLDGWDGPVDTTYRDLAVTVSGDLALCHGLVHTRTTRGGEEAAWWARMTTALARTGDGWRVIHDHVSVPFYMDGSDRAALDLEPQA